MVFITVFPVFLFHHWRLLLSFRCFSCWFRLFISPNVFTLTARYFVFMLLYRECYGFERPFVTLRHFLPYIPDIWHNLLLSRFPWKSVILPWRFKIQTRFIWLLNHTVFSKRYYSVGSIYVLSPTEHYNNLFQVLNLLFNSYIYC